ncbi:Integrase catalytic domain-containing protein [Mycena sanguinolenta]|uniref:Integrase catalytic domain-containing protein n=1 Tax=Mycena sanguinolenta TaxID=230812 RepID=A0A8H6YN48_9AGAR|nr:Integrase catalytic domain-containing protein [Mycena sanguinolenta]
MSEPLHKLTFPRLTEKNYITWVGDECAELQRLGVWHIVKGTIVAPPSTETKELQKWLIDSGKAAGSIYASLDASQKVHVKTMEENPVAMWQVLERVHRQKPRARPSSLDGELASVAMIRALPEEFQSFRSSLFLLSQLDKATVTEAFILEEADRTTQAAKNQEATLALKAAQEAATATAGAAAPPAAKEHCDWCVKDGHAMKDCRTMARVRAELNNKHRGKSDQAKMATEESAGAATMGNASAPDASSPLLVEVGADWNTDTGATSHMTPHRHWFATYQPYCVPICLADNTLIYSAGVGSVQFQPEINGSDGRLVDFEKVLHVPEL